MRNRVKCDLDYAFFLSGEEQTMFNKKTVQDIDVKGKGTGTGRFQCADQRRQSRR